MTDHPRPFGTDNPQDELDEALRHAVDGVRSQPVPVAALHRSLDRARQIEAVRRVPWRGVGKRLLAVAALVVATLLCAEMLKPGPDLDVIVDVRKRDLLDALVQMNLDQEALDRVEAKREAVPEVFILSHLGAVQADRDSVKRALENLRGSPIPQAEIDKLYDQAKKMTADKNAWSKTAEGRWVPRDTKLALIGTTTLDPAKLARVRSRFSAGVDVYPLTQETGVMPTTTGTLARPDLALPVGQEDKPDGKTPINVTSLALPVTPTPAPFRAGEELQIPGAGNAPKPRPDVTYMDIYQGPAFLRVEGTRTENGRMVYRYQTYEEALNRKTPSIMSNNATIDPYAAKKEARGQAGRPEDWAPVQNGANNGITAGMMRGIPPVDPNEGYGNPNASGTYAPTRALIVSGSSRIHTPLGGGLNPGAGMMGMGGGMASPYGGITAPSSNSIGDKGRSNGQLQVERWENEVQRARLLVAKGIFDNQTLVELEKQLNAAKAAAAAESRPAPQVWRRDRQRPTVARVYVGAGNSLQLSSMHVNVTVEGPRARTFVDHVFHNPHNRQLEGTFDYPLPAGASASYFATFAGKTGASAGALVIEPKGKPAGAARKQAPPLPADALARLTPAQVAQQVNADDWGNPTEARIVNKQRALETYEDIVRGNIDPALLEYAGGNTFNGRVFPIPAKGAVRIMFAYEELLPSVRGAVQYRFPLPDRKIDEVQFTLNARQADVKEAVFLPAKARRTEGGGQVRYTKTWTGTTPDGDVVFHYLPTRPDVQVISGRQGENGPHYLYARLRPELPVEAAKPFAEHAVFLLDTSLSEHPDRFDVNVKLMRKILESDRAIKRFNVLRFDVAARWLEPRGWLKNTLIGRNAALEKLDGTLLEGATNLSAALDKLAAPGFDVAAGTPLNVFLLSDGQATWGETEPAVLLSRFEDRCKFNVRFHCYRTGLGADNLELYEALTRRGGGIFHCQGEAELEAAAVAHRHHCFQVERVSIEGGTGTSDLLVGGRRAAIYPGGELIVAARADRPGRAQLVLTGTYQGKPLTTKYPVEFGAGNELAPRGWAEVAVASLLSLNDPKLDSLVTAYCQQFGIGSKVASFLVLENANDYKRLNLEAERGKTVPGGDLGVFLDQAWRNLGRPLGPKATFERFLDRIDARVALKGKEQGAYVRKLLALLGDKDFELPAVGGDGATVAEVEADVPPAYLAAREKDRRDVSAYVAEARRRALAHDEAGAVRALSSVIEEFPTRADALRLVGYRLLDLKQPGQAARLFGHVEESRPFEPHSYRDLARSLEECGNFGPAALQYEIVLAGTWHNRFHESLKQVTREEYASMMRQAIRRNQVSKELANHFGERLEQLVSVKTRSDLRVTISWNTDATDVDLWVVEPNGEKCFYSHNRTKSGGELSQDETQGYGPERYHVAKALPGTYTIYAHYFRVNPNLIAGETHVNVIVTRYADTPQEESRRYNVILKAHDEQAEVCRVKY